MQIWEIKLKKFKRYFKKVLQVQILQPQLCQWIVKHVLLLFSFMQVFNYDLE